MRHVYQYISSTHVESTIWTNPGKYHMMICVADLEVAHLERFINKVTGFEYRPEIYSHTICGRYHKQYIYIYIHHIL